MAALMYLQNNFKEWEGGQEKKGEREGEGRKWGRQWEKIEGGKGEGWEDWTV